MHGLTVATRNVRHFEPAGARALGPTAQARFASMMGLGAASRTRVMPSFDIVSQVDLHEVANALDQANREVGNRFDFKGVDASFEMAGKDLIQLRAEAEFQLRQMLDILRGKLVKRGVDTRSFAEGEVEISGRTATLPLNVRQGIESDVARELVRLVKTAKLKVQTSIQGDQLRVAGKKRDDLQNVIALVKEAKPDLPLQYVNFRD